MSTVHTFLKQYSKNNLDFNQLSSIFFNQRHAMDIRNISQEFTQEPVPNSLCRSSSIGPSSIPEHHFQGFSYAPSNLYN